MGVQFKDVAVSSCEIDPDERGVVQAIVSTTNVVDHVNDQIEPGAYAETLKRRTPKGCWAHDWKIPVSKTLAAIELLPGDTRLPVKLLAQGAGGLQVLTKFNLATTRGNDAYEDVKFWSDTSESEWSIGYDAMPPEGKAFIAPDGVRHIEALALYEYSPVIFGAAPDTTTQVVKSLFGEGFDAEALTPVQKSLLRQAVNAVLSGIAGKAGTESGKVTCKLCNGSGKILEGHRQCPDCQGSGKVTPEVAEDQKLWVPEAAEAKAAIPAHSTPVDKGTPWDGPATVAALASDATVGELRKEFAWVDPKANPDTKSAYKFPHHDVSDGTPGSANVRACQAIIGVLNGSRGGAKIPEADRQGVYSHAAKHLRDAGVDVPELKSLTDPMGGTAVGPERLGQMPRLTIKASEPTHSSLVTGQPENPETEPTNDAWPPSTPEDAAMTKDGTPRMAMATGRKAFVELEGSFEDTQCDLSDLLSEWLNEMLPDVCAWIWVEATYPAYVVAGVGYDPDGDMCGNPFAPIGMDDNVEYWQIPYTRDLATDTYTFGAPAPVDVQGVAVPRDAASGPNFQALDFLSPAKVIQRGLAAKNATRLRRHLLLLAANGQDISATGLTPQQLAESGGVGSIPQEGAPSYLTDVTDTTPEGGAGNTFTEPAIQPNPTVGDGVGPGLPSWLEGTWYLDNSGNLVSSPIPDAVINAPAGDQTAPAVPPQGDYTNNAGVVPGVTNAGPNIATVASTVLGTLDLGKSMHAGPAKARRKKAGSLLPKMQQAYGAFFRSAPGAGGPGTAPSTEAPATGTISDEQLSKLAPQIDGAIKAVASMLVSLKEGRVLSSDNASRVQNAHAAIGDAHAALTEILDQAGVDPLHPEDAFPNETAGDDEDGVPIEVEDAKSGKAVQVKGLPMEDILSWQQERTAPISV